jgi:hypothetical protein
MPEATFSGLGPHEHAVYRAGKAGTRHGFVSTTVPFTVTAP